MTVYCGTFNVRTPGGIAIVRDTHKYSGIIIFQLFLAFQSFWKEPQYWLGSKLRKRSTGRTYRTIKSRALVKSSTWLSLLSGLQTWCHCTVLQHPVCSGPQLSPVWHAVPFLQREVHVAQAIPGVSQTLAANKYSALLVHSAPTQGGICTAMCHRNGWCVCLEISG